MKAPSGPGRGTLRGARRKGSALVMSLVIVVLITVITVGYLASVMLETKTARAGLDQQKAHSMAVMGFHAGMAKLRDGLGPWDNPLQNFASNAPPFYWSLSPGRLTRWSYADIAPASNVALFSEADTTNVVNLNRRLSEGAYPIIAGTNPPAVSVKWINVLRDPSQSSGTNNPVIGRYAFWIDDEGAKINLNTSDGTAKYSNSSLGVGSPSEVSLEVLTDSGTALSETAARDIVQIARSNGFLSPREILRSSAVTLDAFTNNVFYLTTTSRSPEMNVFGQPRIAVMPGLGDARLDATDIVTNGITLRALTEIYPTPSQLPNVSFRNPKTGETANVVWPLVFRQEYSVSTMGRAIEFDSMPWSLSLSNYTYANGVVMARYLSGTNAAGRPIAWPVFPGSGSGGFAGKYSLRQLDSIAAQICNFGSRAISPDVPYSSDSSGMWLSWYMHTSKDRFSAPVIYPGFVSGQWVSGIGRSPKVTSLLMHVITSPPAGLDEPPTAGMDLWLEWWLPSAYRAGSADDSGKNMVLGQRNNANLLNVIDAAPFLENNTRLPNEPAVLPKTTSGYRQTSGNGSFWSNQLMFSPQGIDFRGNPKSLDDPDQALAQQYHDPYARNPLNPTGPLLGEGAFSPAVYADVPYYSSPFLMAPLAGYDYLWSPGDIRVVRNLYGSATALSMSINSTGLQIEGGIQVRAQIRGGLFSDPDPVPLESIRGIYVEGVNPDGTARNAPLAMLTHEEYGASANTPGNSAETVRQRAIASVIPTALTMGIGEERWVRYYVDDPLVNKFPGDWKSEPPSPSPPVTTMQYQAATTSGFHRYGEDDAWRASLADRDSYWMPQIDSIYSEGQTPLIPRSARFPSIGYLQYLRTGIIPDDESVPYAQQKGTPFRLLSYAPSTEASSGDPLAGQRTTRSGSQSYPDWAMLDLFYVPSTLRSYGGPYGTATNLAAFGTYGGATAGRINPNGAVIYTTNVEVPQADVSRTIPLQAVFAGLKINPIVQGSGTNVTSGATWAGSPVDAEAIAGAIESYIRTNGPLRMPAEICNVPYVASLRAPANKSRNDLVRQSVGNLTTQGNVFSVWTAGQVVAKKPSNSSYGEFEAGDNVLSEVRLHFIVERYMDPGADGVYGNKSNLGSDLVMGSYDDPVDPVNHPFEPRYLYRVIASEEIR